MEEDEEGEVAQGEEDMYAFMPRRGNERGGGGKLQNSFVELISLMRPDHLTSDFLFFFSPLLFSLGPSRMHPHAHTYATRGTTGGGQVRKRSLFPGAVSHLLLEQM